MAKKKPLSAQDHYPDLFGQQVSVLEDPIDRPKPKTSAILPAPSGIIESPIVIVEPAVQLPNFERERHAAEVRSIVRTHFPNFAAVEAFLSDVEAHRKDAKHLRADTVCLWEKIQSSPWQAWVYASAPVSSQSGLGLVVTSSDGKVEEIGTLVKADSQVSADYQAVIAAVRVFRKHAAICPRIYVERPLVLLEGSSSLADAMVPNLITGFSRESEFVAPQLILALARDIQRAAAIARAAIDEGVEKCNLVTGPRKEAACEAS